MVVDARVMGQRIAEARGRAGWTQAELAAEVSIDRSALAKIELGQRKVSALELSRLSQALDIRIEWFLDDAPPAILSRRNTQEPGAPSPRIDMLAERVTREVEFLATHDSRFRLPSVPVQDVPTTSDDAEALAATARRLMDAPASGPAVELTSKVATCGLAVFSFDLGAESADAATIVLQEGGVALVNGVLQVGRRRLALAHEFGHYLVADEYTVDWRVAEHQSTEQREYLLDRFARALLLPENSVRDDWARYLSAYGDLRIPAVRMASEYRVDMSTLARRLRELEIVGRDDAATIRSVRTTRADIVELNLVVPHELAPPSLPREYELAVLRLFRRESISTTRALDLLFDTWSADMLPELSKRDENEIWQYI